MDELNTIVVNDEELKKVLIDKLRDMIDLPMIEFLKKYDISERTYRYWKRDYVFYYNIDPRHLYQEKHIKNIKELKPYIDDEKFNLPLEKQLIMPTTASRMPGYITGKKTIQINKHGEIVQAWLKQNLNQEELRESILKSIKSLCHEKLKPLPIIKSPKISDNDLLTFYPIPDAHFGMYINSKEVNHNFDYDLNTAQKWFTKASQYLIDRSPNSKTAIVCDLGDFLHSQDNLHRTPTHQHPLDVDQRHFKVVNVAFDCMRFILEKALEKHKEVIFISIAGNHDPYTPIYIKTFIRAWFKDNKRLIIPDNYKAQQYYQFGKTLLGFSHGHQLKPEKNASEVMVYDNKDIFSNTEFRYFHFGHFHHSKQLATSLVNIEVHNNLPPRDVYADSKGYRGIIGQAKSIIYHNEFGEINRNIINLPFILDKN